MTEERSAYLDELTLAATWGLLRHRGLKRVSVLEGLKRRQRLWRWVFGRNGVCVSEASFFAGHLKTEEGEAVRIRGFRLAGQIALRAAKQVVQSTRQLNSMNTAYGRNTVELFIARQLHLHIDYWTSRVLVVQALCTSDRAEVWLRKPTRFDGRLLVEAFPSVEIRFYSTLGFGPIELAKSWLLDVLRDIKLTFGLGQHNRPSTQGKSHEQPLSLVFAIARNIKQTLGFRRCNKTTEASKINKPSVLMLQEGNIRADRSLRGQPHWLDGTNQPEMLDIYVVASQSSTFSFTEDEEKLAMAGVKILSTSSFRSALHARRDDKTLMRIRRDRRTAIQAVFQTRGFVGKFFLLRLGSLLRQAELMGAMALWLNSTVFLVRETYFSFADAIQLVAPDLNVTTLACQYSNMGCISPLMMSTADKLLIFSDMYKSIYQSDGIAPKEFVLTGYLCDYVAGLVVEKARQHREALNRAGAQFVVCYFDESVQHDRWGLVSKCDHLGELHTLANSVLTDPAFGVVVKSQFIRNSPSRLYPEDDLIQAAKASGRYLELIEGVHRNDIYPTEAALVADLCISNKFGATAALEAAIAGVRTVILNAYGTKTLWDSIYAKADIEYESIDALMVTIGRYRAGNAAQQALGDWAPILQYFDPYRDGKAAERLRQEILEHI